MSQFAPYDESPEVHFVTFNDVIRNTKFIVKTHGKYLFSGYLLIVGLIKLVDIAIAGALIGVAYFFPNSGAAIVAASLALFAVSIVLSFIFGAIQLGLYRPFHKVVMSGQAGSRLPKSFLATVFERFGALLIFSLLTSLGIVLGLFLCIVPGIAVALVALPTGYLVATRNIGTMEAYNETFRVLQHNAGPIIICYLIMIGAGIALFVPMFFVQTAITPLIAGSLIGSILILLFKSFITFAFSTMSWFLVGGLYSTVFDGGPPQMRRYMAANIDDGPDSGAHDMQSGW